MLKLYHMENPNLAVGGNGGAGEADNGQKKSLLDKLTNLGGTPKPEEPIDYSKLENVKTKSMVESRRANATQELQQLQMLEEQRLAQIRMDEKVAAAKKTSVYVTVAVICIVLLICLVFFFLSLAKYLRKPTDAEIGGGTGGSSQVANLGTYACKKADCEVVLEEMADGRQLIRDDGYLLYDQGKEESFILTLEGDYADFTEFSWGDKQYLLAKNTEGLGAIFSTTDNKYITDAIYESVISDATDGAYAGLDWVIGKFIIAKRSGSYRLVDITDGTEKVSGILGVFATKSGYYVAREENDILRVFNSSKNQVLLTESGQQLYERDGFLIVATSERFEIYKDDGSAARSEECPFYNELREKDRGTIVDFLNGNSAYTHIK